MKNADTVIVLDFETTGLSPACGDRAIEIGAVRLEKGRVTDKFQSLMNPGMHIDAFIESYTGITNGMLSNASSCKTVMKEFAEFIEDFNLVAHNASFDKKFLDSEMNNIKEKYCGDFACSMLIARRVYPDAPNHKLSTLVKHKNLPTDGTFHRALADADMTASLWLSLLDDIHEKYGSQSLGFTDMQKLSQVNKNSVPMFFKNLC